MISLQMEENNQCIVDEFKGKDTLFACEFAKAEITPEQALRNKAVKCT